MNEMSGQNERDAPIAASKLGEGSGEGPMPSPSNSLLHGGDAASVVEIPQPDEMGVWNEDGDLIWLPRRLYPKRFDAIRWAMDQWSCDFLGVRCLARWMRWEPFVAYQLDGSVAWQEDQWWECERTAEGAFQVWRLEGV